MGGISACEKACDKDGSGWDDESEDESEVDPNDKHDPLAEFSFGKTVGTGAYGRVRIATHMPTSKPYAVKTMKKIEVMHAKQTDHVVCEANILAKMRHPFIVNLFGCCQDDRYIHMVMEFVVGGEFFTHLRRCHKFSNQQSSFYAAQITLIFEHCHKQDIVYRDLKPENILIGTDGYAKLTDFGFAKVVEARTYTLCGTPEYLAPEIIQNKGHGKAVDWWTLGILIYEMLIGHAPFVDDDPLRIYKQILACNICFKKFTNEDAKDIVGQLVQPDLSKRYGNLKNGVNDIKQHRWFKDINWESLLKKSVPSPFKPEVKSAVDTSNFDFFPEESKRDKPSPVKGKDDPFLKSLPQLGALG